MQIVVRVMVGDDLATLASIMSKAQEWAKHSAPIRESDLDAFLKAVVDETVYVAEVNGTVLGFASVYDRSFLHHLYVHPSQQRKGIGSELLRACMDSFERTATLKCLTKSDQAVQFYLSHGWQVIGEGEGPDGPYLVFFFEKGGHGHTSE